jgi:hypothetical protein
MITSSSGVQGFIGAKTVPGVDCIWHWLKHSGATWMVAGIGEDGSVAVIRAFQNRFTWFWN